jgi:hypothetical protein
MPSYESYRNSIDKLQSVLVEDMLKEIAFKDFEDTRGHKVTQVLPGSNEEYEFNIMSFDGYIDTKSRKMYNPCFDGTGLTINQMASNPYIFDEIGTEFHDAWEELIGEIIPHTSSYNDVPITQDELDNEVSKLQGEFDIICSDPTLIDLVYAINDQNYLLAARFLGVDEPQHLMTPGGGHELSNLFTKGDIHICYMDRDIAILKPEYNHEMRARVMNQRRQWEQVSLRGEQPEEAVVVGYDDTPVGLFAHVIDGTRINVGQEISREYINNVMGFDRSYEPRNENLLRLNLGEKVRLQGDLGLEYMGSIDSDEDGICYIPLDNHLISLENGGIPAGESLEREPILVNIPEKTVLNIAHDEHENVVVEIEKGQYKFYLLPRGLKQEQDRPDWPEPTVNS